MYCKIPALKYLSRSFAQSCRRCFVTQTMQSIYPSLQTVVTILNGYAAESLAEKWDNVGLLIEPFPESPIRNIMLTIDLTEQVMQEAMTKSIDLIISYHPPIFAPLKRITQKSWKERIVNHCLRNGIAVYSPHTSWDNAPDGINNWLADALPQKSAQPIMENQSGGALLCEVEGNLSLSDATLRIQKHVNLEHVMVGKAPNAFDSIRTYAVCAGSGASVLKGVKADLYVTGEMSHHEILEAKQQGSHVILLGHCNSERGFLSVFRNRLIPLLADHDVDLYVSEKDGDPLKLVYRAVPRAI